MTANIRKLPDLLANVVASIEDEAQKAAARLSSAKLRHKSATVRIHEVADVIEKATAKSEDLLNQMMGGNSGPTLEGSTPSTQPSQNGSDKPEQWEDGAVNERT